MVVPTEHSVYLRWLSVVQMLNALQLCGASLDDYLHLLVPPIVKAFETDTNPLEVRRSDLLPQCWLVH